MKQIALNPKRYSVTVNGKETNLTNIQFQTLKCLIDADGDIVTFREFYTQVWRMRPSEPLDAYGSLRVFISQLRKVVGPTIVIKNRAGIGYQLVEHE